MRPLALALFAAVTSPSFADEPPKPNVVFILIDDMGYGDLSCYGNTDIQTTNIDKLAADGIKFTNFYVASPICSPSRVGFLTGQYPSRHHIHSFLANRKRNRERGMADFLDPEAPSIARTLKQAGYATGHFGKWHMGGGRDVDDAPLPQAYGFDKSFVCFEGLGDRVLPPGGLSQASAKLGQGKITHAERNQLSEIHTGAAIDFIKANREKPFYVQLWLNDVHDAYFPTDTQLKKFERYSDRKYIQQYYAVMDEMDRQIGRLIDTIDDLGLAEDTLILLASDNGPTAWPKYYKEDEGVPGKTDGLRGRKWSLYEGGIRQPFIVRWNGKIPAGKTDETTVLHACDLFRTVCWLTGVEPPAARFDGQNMGRAILGTPIDRRGPLFWEYGRDESFLKPGREIDRSPNCALRDGKWKFLIDADGTDAELYDLSADPDESDNLAAESPDRTARYTEILLDWRRALPAQPGDGK